MLIPSARMTHAWHSNTARRQLTDAQSALALGQWLNCGGRIVARRCTCSTVLRCVHNTWSLKPTLQVYTYFHVTQHGCKLLGSASSRSCPWKSLLFSCVGGHLLYLSGAWLSMRSRYGTSPQEQKCARSIVVHLHGASLGLLLFRAILDTRARRRDDFTSSLSLFPSPSQSAALTMTEHFTQCIAPAPCKGRPLLHMVLRCSALACGWPCKLPRSHTPLLSAILVSLTCNMPSEMARVSGTPCTCYIYARCIGRSVSIKSCSSIHSEFMSPALPLR